MISASSGTPLPEGEDSEDEWGLVLAFDSDDPEFARGVEIGSMWTEVEENGRCERMIRGNNAEMAMRIAEAKGLPFEAEPHPDDWFYVRIGI